VHAGFVDGAQSVALEADAARGAADELDDAFAGQGLQVFLGGVGGFEPQLGGNFRPGGGRAGACNGTLDQVQNLLLTGGEFHRELGQVHHDDSLVLAETRSLS
jgi:hypothetical protein